jgi:hypothetical protein
MLTCVLENAMKTIYFENIVNKEKFYCNDIKDVRNIDGIEYIRVFRYVSHRECLIRKDTLKKVKDFSSKK